MALTKQEKIIKKFTDITSHATKNVGCWYEVTKHEKNISYSEFICVITDFKTYLFVNGKKVKT